MLAAVVQVAAPALVPPFNQSVMLDRPLVTSEVRMFSMEAAVRAHPEKALIKALETRFPVVSNILAGNVLKLEQTLHALFRLVAEAKLSAGNAVRPEQNCHAS